MGMSALLERPPFATRDDAQFLSEMLDLTAHHLRGCAEFARMWAGWRVARTVADLPFVHIGLFKRLTLKTSGASHERVLRSSGTSGTSSMIALDAESSTLQSRSSLV